MSRKQAAPAAARAAVPLPDVDLSTPPDKKSRSRDFRNGVRNNIISGKNPVQYGYAWYIKDAFPNDQAAMELASKIDAVLDWVCNAEYLEPKTEAEHGSDKEAAIRIKLWTPSHLITARPRVEELLGKTLAETAGDWEIKGRSLELAAINGGILAKGTTFFLEPQFLRMLEHQPTITGLRDNEQNGFFFTCDQDEVLSKWLVRQVQRICSLNGVIVADKTGYFEQGNTWKRPRTFRRLRPVRMSRGPSSPAQLAAAFMRSLGPCPPAPPCMFAGSPSETFAAKRKLAPQQAMQAPSGRSSMSASSCENTCPQTGGLVDRCMCGTDDGWICTVHA